MPAAPALAAPAAAVGAKGGDVTPPPAEAEPPAPRGPTVKDADTAFLAERYGEAGTVYAALDRAGRLPADRRAHWAYCRAVGVVRRINGRPKSSEEWAAIDAEIRDIRTLSPSNWFAEYLRNLASERSRDPRARSARSNKVVVRGSSPEETSAANGSRPSPSKPKPAPPATAPATVLLPGSTLAWNRQPVETANFQVYYVGSDPALAERVAAAAEAARGAQAKRLGTASGGAWSPRCEVLLYPARQEFSRDTRQPPDSPGFSSMGMNAGRIVFRRVHLRVDNPNAVKAVLPHEVTHVVLADLFPHQQVPRWADEGLAVLAEPVSEQSVRAAELDEPLRAGRVFRLSDLMVMDYPDGKYWGLYYAQSVSLTRFLVETGTPAQFVRFVQEAQRSGFEPALQQVYQIQGFSDLQTRWLAYARERSSGAAEITASSSGSEKNPETTRR